MRSCALSDERGRCFEVKTFGNGHDHGLGHGRIFRITALYTREGDAVADTDVVAKPPMAELLNSLPADLNQSVEVGAGVGGAIPEAERIGSICFIPAFIARAQASTSGTKIKFSRNLIPTMPIPAINPSSITSSASIPSSSASRVS